MPAAPPPFRLLSPEQFALLTAREKTDYLNRLTLDINKHLREFREHNKRVVEWLVHKDDIGK